MDYNWDCPHHWLRDHLTDFYFRRGETTARSYFEKLVIILSAELQCSQIQDLFEAEMELDGYFKEE